MRSDLDASFVEIVFTSFNRRRFLDNWLALDNVDRRLSVIDNILFNFLTRCIDFFFADEGWITVELTIGEVACRRPGII